VLLLLTVTTTSATATEKSKVGVITNDDTAFDINNIFKTPV